jgi:hypothetical protein
MYSTRRISGLFLLALMIMNCSINAALKYQQEMGVSTCAFEETWQLTQAFCQAAEDDPDIMVVDIQYGQKKDGESTWYNATIKCLVSKRDVDIYRTQGKMIRLRNEDQQPNS